jgi:membrane protein
MIHRIKGYVRRLVTEPIGELNRAEKSLRFASNVAVHCAGELRRNDAGQMAAAMTYRTIFSLVPTMVLLLLVFRGFGGFEQMRGELEERIYNYVGLSSIALTEEGVVGGAGVEAVVSDVSAIRLEPESEAEIEAKERVSEEVRANIHKVMSDLTQNMSKVSSGSIGVVGLVLLIWGALSLVVTVEDNFNKIYHCERGRAWHARVSIYWAVITLGPVLLFVSLYVAGALVKSAAAWGEGGGWVSGLVASGSGLTALAASWLLLFLLYLLMPNARVRVRPALLGGFVAAVLWEAGKWGFKLYVKRAVTYSVLYGSLGLIPLFLIWVYITWLVVFFGLQITYTIQTVRDGRFDRAAEAAGARVFDPQWLLPMLTVIGKAFAEGKVVSHGSLAGELGLTMEVVSRMAVSLEDVGLIRRAVGGSGMKSGDEGYVLAVPPDRIAVSRVLSMAQEITLPGDSARGRQSGWSIVRDLYAAQREKVGETTLAAVIARH